jgi:predicted naringenin-chalcone synthase
MSYLNSIGTAVPPNKSSQMDIYDYMSTCIPYSEKERKVLKFLYKKSGIKTRYSVLSDFNGFSSQGNFYSESNQFNPRVEERLSQYDQHALPLAIEAISDCIQKNKIQNTNITHIITVSCTGMSAPGMDTMLINHFNFNSGIQRFNVNFMGCYAALNGLRIADTICKADVEAKVLLVCVELCTLHFQNLNSADYNLSNMLFADGAAAALITAEPKTEMAMNIHGFVSDINMDGEKDMSWNISSSGFLMKLSSYVPRLLSMGFKELIEKILGKYGLEIKDLSEWAIHPGGKRILDNIEQEFRLEDSQLEASRGVLESFGNMSSPTILFVLQSIQNNQKRASGNYVFTAAFGPGLTTETALLSYV